MSSAPPPTPSTIAKKILVKGSSALTQVIFNNKNNNDEDSSSSVLSSRNSKFGSSSSSLLSSKSTSSSMIMSNNNNNNNNPASGSSSSILTSTQNIIMNSTNQHNHHQENVIIANDAASFTLLSLISNLADIVMIIGTAPGWIMQLRSILRKGSAAGFSWQTGLLLLFCYTIRVGYYFGEHFHIALLLQCFVMITVVLSLIAAIVDSPDSSTPLTRYQFQHITKSEVNESTQVSEDDFNNSGTYVHSADEEIYIKTLHPQLATAKRMFDKMFKRRWAGGSYYFGFIPWDGPNTKYVYTIYFIILGIVCYVCANRLPGNPFLTKVVGFLALGIEGSVVLPQVILTESRRSVEGLSTFLVATWFFGDLMKVLYFLAKSQPMPFVVCGVSQFALDIFIIGQFLRFGDNRATPVQSNKQVDGVTLQHSSKKNKSQWHV